MIYKKTLPFTLTFRSVKTIDDYVREISGIHATSFTYPTDSCSAKIRQKLKQCISNRTSFSALQMLPRQHKQVGSSERPHSYLCGRVRRVNVPNGGFISLANNALKTGSSQLNRPPKIVGVLVKPS